MSDPYIGEIRPFGFNFAPRNWAFCRGQILAISSNTALFSILGTTYGGNGQTTFALPNLQSRVTVGMGTGPGLSTYVLGEQTGEENHTLLTSEMPAHTHAPYTRVKPGTADGRRVPASGDYLTRLNVAANAPGLTWLAAPLTNATTLHPSAIGLTGGNQPHSNLQPTLAINYCICLNGVFPARN